MYSQSETDYIWSEYETTAKHSEQLEEYYKKFNAFYKGKNFEHDVKLLSREYPNDQQFGAEVRKLLRKAE